jgi:hypothetical protein
MIALFLMLAAQVAPNAALPAKQRDCVRAVGSEIMVCGTPPEQQQQQQAQQGIYRLPRVGRPAYGPLPGASTDLGGGVRASLRGQATNSGRAAARRNKPVATLSVPF